MSRKFIPYVGTYVKQMYDIITDEGEVVRSVYPNAGKFNLMDGSGRQICESHVIAVRADYESRAGQAFLRIDGDSDDWIIAASAKV